MKDLVVIGQGYVGLPLSRAASNAGLNVTGLDVSQRIVDDLNAGKSHVEDIPASDLRQMLNNGYQATTDNTVIQNADVVVICVPTPLGDAGRPDLQAVESATQATAENLRRQTLVVLESTTIRAPLKSCCFQLWKPITGSWIRISTLHFLQNALTRVTRPTG